MFGRLAKSLERRAYRFIEDRQRRRAHKIAQTERELRAYLKEILK